jgi:thiol:disulfide interchange protein DsbA
MNRIVKEFSIKSLVLSINEKAINAKAINIMLISILGLMFSGFAFSESYVEGKHYRVLDKPGIPTAPGKIEVREFFWYGCPHCFSLEGKVANWKKSLASDVNFVASPAVAAPNWQVLGAAFFAAENLGIAEKSHGAVFNAIHRDKKTLSTPDQVAEFYTQFGVSKQDFLNQMDAFSVKTSLRKSEALFRQYQLTGVPAIIVNGKYQPTGHSYDEMLRVVDYLIEKERSEMVSGATVK